jgi:predicted secreted protein
MATIVGTDGVAKFDVTGSATTIASVRSFSISQVGDIIETSVMGTQAKSYLPGQTSFTGTMDVLFNSGDSAQDTLAAAVGSDPATVELYPSGEVSGKKFTGEVIITGYDLTADQNDAVTATVSFQGTGALTYASV